ncbi:MAG: zinc ribbon domain-containing protein [Chlorobiaceae bacterium]|nr:zinc ribbon domain-containing protein [Chlorobiaceae bacterium]
MDVPYPVIAVFVSIFTGLISYAIAENKGHTGNSLWLWFAIGFLFNVLGVVASLLISKVKVCPSCKESVKSDAILCKHCGSKLETAIPA